VSGMAECVRVNAGLLRMGDCVRVARLPSTQNQICSFVVLSQVPPVFLVQSAAPPGFVRKDCCDRRSNQGKGRKERMTGSKDREDSKRASGGKGGGARAKSGEGEGWHETVARTASIGVSCLDCTCEG
jgi:hypothetical protein